ncbi:hypothetical protein PIB30_077921 [Stylosanthes scabra]|uniref:Uncharacterized protein n=1 Tax=Stylosanthes scabra TaxID=79078 RepID=A0ABU6ZPD0_9FABA|nr:hypothetical protein [Stylosanthes scabra]
MALAAPPPSYSPPPSISPPPLIAALQVQSATITYQHLLSISLSVPNVQTKSRASSSSRPERCRSQKSRTCTPPSRRRPLLLAVSSGRRSSSRVSIEEKKRVMIRVQSRIQESLSQ